MKTLALALALSVLGIASPGICQTADDDPQASTFKADEAVANRFFAAIAANDAVAANAELAPSVELTEYEVRQIRPDSGVMFGANLFGKVLVEGYHRISLDEENAPRGRYQFGGTFGFADGRPRLNVEVEIESEKIVRVHRYWLGTPPPPMAVMPIAPTGTEATE